MKPTEDHDSVKRNVSFRLGAAALGLLSGTAIGFVVAVALSMKWASDGLFALLVFGGAAIGAVGGYVRWSVGLGLAEASAHFGIGFVLGLAERFVNPIPEAPSWLKRVYWIGVTVGAACLVRLYW